ncbi:PTS sugar transporter subunit IIA [Oceanobacillus jeddahense]|uniref:PTS glucose transporter subunit IIA n=1 Tax=Oceanobacillus jeddahense TaxID=1462527 RepID=A0ABY5JQ39_9BACI|nr:PTS glucose transporter subunit IIA [Oceanobacillus jeddahense]UUI02432.1 PTS glucose transporter subunit IIA [Oceanobacillus jeddahense]
MFANLFEKKISSFVSPLEGRIKNLDKVKDETFSQKVMGDGFAIEPKTSEIYSPVNGTVEFVLGTNHAIGLKSVDGVELLIHVGVYTISLKGKGFTPHVEVKQDVKQGDLLLTVDFDVIKNFVPSTDVIVIFTSGEKCEILKPNDMVGKSEEQIIKYTKFNS